MSEDRTRVAVKQAIHKGRVPVQNARTIKVVVTAGLWTVLKDSIGMALSPVKGVMAAAEFIVNVMIIAAVVTVAAWWTGRISDDLVASVLLKLGERVMSTLSQAGIL